MTHRNLTAVIALCVASLLPSAVQAGGGCCGGALPYYNHFGREHIPYFALHPPVYYSYPVPRTYGYSPFAYPVGSQTPEVVLPTAPPSPQIMHNPYFKGVKKRLERTTQATPQVIINPYVNTRLVSAPAE